MPRKFRPQNLRETDRTNLEAAFNYKVAQSTNIRKAAHEFGVKVMTLQDAFKRSKLKSDGVTYVPVQDNFNKIFTATEESMLCEYAIQVARLFYGLTRKDFRRLAYDYAVACKCTNIPEKWHVSHLASENWYYSFMDRHPNLSLKSPEGMSIARITSFNKTNVATFFTAYSSAMQKYELGPDRIYNVDETSISTVVKPVKVLCQSGQRAAAQITRERGASMTFVGIINAAGHFIPPVFIFPRKRFNDEFFRGTIHGTKGIFHGSGWMNGECWVDTLQHIQKNTKCTPDNKIILIMDNAECHMTIAAIQYAIDNGIVIVTLPPHTTARLQPLDVSIYGPFKTCYKVMMHDHQITHPHTSVREQEIPEIACRAWIKACTPHNVLSGFRSTGIWPLNRDIFTDLDFLGATVCERELPSTSSSNPQGEASNQSNVNSNTPLPTTPTAEGGRDDQTPQSNENRPSLNQQASSDDVDVPTSPLSPEIVRPYPKAPPRPQGKGKPRVKSCILTEDSAAIQILLDKEAKKEKKRKASENKKQTGSRPKAAKKTAPPKSLTSGYDDDSDSDSLIEVDLNDSSEYSDEDFTDEPHPRDETNIFQDKAPEVGDYLLVEIPVEEGKTKGSMFNYVSKVLDLESAEKSGMNKVSFLRKSKRWMI